MGQSKPDIVEQVRKAIRIVRAWTPRMEWPAERDVVDLCFRTGLDDLLRGLVLALCERGKDGLARQLEDAWTVLFKYRKYLESETLSQNAAEHKLADELLKQYGFSRRPDQNPWDILYKAFGICFDKKNLVMVLESVARVLDPEFADRREDEAESSPGDVASEATLGSEAHRNAAHLSEPELEVLYCLSQAHPQIRLQSDIAASCKHSTNRKTVRKHLEKLMSHGLVSRPKDRRRGYIITDQGKYYLETHF